MKKRIFLCALSIMLLLFTVSCGKNGEDLVIRQEDVSGEEDTGQEDSESLKEDAEVSSGRDLQEKEEIWVDISGAVNTPGVYRLAEGARVFEAVQAAGGFPDDADTQWLNQAAMVSDGEKIRVYTKEETEKMKEQGISQAQESGESPAGGESAKKVNLNTADAEELQTIPGIGAARAAAIISYREEAGGFGSIEDIQNVSGIKGKTFEKIEEYITVE